MNNMISRCLFMLWCQFSVVLSVIVNTPIEENMQSKCNVYNGNWVKDASYPLYDSTCPFIRQEFACQKYGRPDSDYLKYRWQPSGCDLPRFEGAPFMEKMRGKKIMFVGDSVILNQFESFLCLIHRSLPSAAYTMQRTLTGFQAVFSDYRVEINVFTSHYLVDIDQEAQGRVLKLGSIKSGEVWKQMDVLIFNTWLWWYRSGPERPWDYVEDNGTIMKDMNRMEAYTKALATWAKWVDSDVDFSKTKVVFQGVTPTHYNSTEWKEAGAMNCGKETEPLLGSNYPAGTPYPQKVLENVLRGVKNPVYLLDITNLSQLRKDGHPSAYNRFKGMDCTHWCLSGVPDTWNLILYDYIMNN